MYQDLGEGFLNIIDLANKYSCPFISTEDVGEVFENGNLNYLAEVVKQI